MKNNLSTIITGLIISIGISSMGYFVSQTLYNSKMALNTAEVKGLAEIQVKSNASSWQLSLSVSGSNKLQIPKLYKKIKGELKQVEEIFLSVPFFMDKYGTFIHAVRTVYYGLSDKISTMATLITQHFLP